MKKITALIVMCICFFSTAVYGEEIYTYETADTITSGVVWKNIKKFYNDYSLNINCIVADLKNEHLSMELLKSKKGVDKADTLLNLANGESGVVAAVNADFFSYYKGSQYFSLGLEMKDGELLQSHIDSNMAAGIVRDNVLSLGYIELKTELTLQNGNILPVTHINKPTDYYGALLMYTPDFNSGVSPFFPNGITVATVTDSTVSAIGVSMGGTVPIPANGYILAINDNMTPMINSYLAVGDTVVLNTTAQPTLENAKTAFGGGTMLLKEGKKTEITHKSAGYNPRTVIGTNSDGTEIYLITVDGRQSSSKGATLEMLADICMELGCVNAMNLDGGGSTSMVGKELDNSSLHHLNKPSENRKIVNGIAIVSDAKGTDATGFKVTAESYNVLVGDSVKIEVLPHDEYYNPISVTGYDWVVSKGSGSVSNNIFTADKGGETVIDLYYKNNWQASCTFNVIDDVYGINAPVKIELSPWESFGYNGEISVFDKNGNTAIVNDISLLKPVCDLNFLSMDGEKITALKKGNTFITLTHGDVVRFINVCCDSDFMKAPDPVFKDEFNVEYSIKPTFSIAAGLNGATFIDRLTYKNALSSFSQSNTSAVLGGEVIDGFTQYAAVPYMADNYGEMKIKNSDVVSLDLSKKGSLRSDSQWEKFKKIATYSKEKNLFVLMNSKPEFTDSFEAQVFDDYLTDVAKVKNVFVVYNGEENSGTIRNNVRYISLASRKMYSDLNEAIAEMKYVSFNIGENSVTYSFETIFK